MDLEAKELESLLDREKIRDCLVTLARGEDRRDAELISSAYWPDARTDYGVFEGSFDDYLAWVVPGAEAIKNTQHVLGQSFIALDGDVARAESHVISYHRIDMGEGERDTCIGGRYLDGFERREGQWRIAHRLMLYDWYQDWGEAIDWSGGLMGQALSGEHFSGRSVGDYSERFFSGKQPGISRDPE